MIIHINRLIIYILDRLIVTTLIQITQLRLHFRILLVDYLLNFVLYCLVMISLIKYGLTISTATSYHRLTLPTGLFAVL